MQRFSKAAKRVEPGVYILIIFRKKSKTNQKYFNNFLARWDSFSCMQT